jgi:hypothetical protein
MRKLLTALFIGAWSVVYMSNAAAWGNPGHQTVGAIADQLIAGTHASQEVSALLQPGETLESVAIWADCAKGYCGPLTDEMREFVAANPKHHDYHFTDLPFEANAYSAGAVGTTDHDVVQILRECIMVLRGDQSPNSNPHGLSKRQALLLLTHLVGDIHQPLHVGTAYMDTNNQFIVPESEAAIDEASIFATQGDNFLLKGGGPLHGYWDTQAVKMAMAKAHATTPQAFAQALIAQAPNVPPSVGDVVDWPAQWATETVLLSHRAHDGVRPLSRQEVQDRNGGSSHNAWPVATPKDYATTARDIAHDQLWAGGKRLALVLQTIWP